MIEQGLYSIPLDQNFLKTLAAGVLKETGDQPLKLRGYTIFLPTRRAIRELKKLFLDHHKGPSLILPKMIALGEISEEELNLTDIELAPQIPPLKRQAMLAKLIKAFEGQGYDMSTPQAFRLASDLMGLIDQVILEDLDFEDLKTLVSENYAEHWQVTLDFLEIITHHWPKILEEEGLKESATVRREAIERFLKSWEDRKPDTPFILAGSTGSLKLTRELMKGILKLPQGRVVLPGFRPQDFETALNHPTHPQHTLSVSVKECGGEVREWPSDKSFLNANIETVSQALLPELNTQKDKLSLSNVHRLDCANELEEASGVALILREAVEDSNKTAMLVTPDRTLARRVASHLKRWDIKVDDSSGKPLSETPVGILTRLTSEFFLNPNDPGLLLSLLKHPFTRLGMKASDIRSLSRLLEKKYVRGALAGADLLEDLKGRVVEGALKNLLEVFQRESQDLRGVFKNPPFEFEKTLSLHQKFLAKITKTDEGDTLILNRNGGPQLESLLSDLSQNAGAFPDVEAGDYPALLNLMMSGVSVRNTIPAHPRISILGPLEARLLTADRVILAGLNEGTWPLQPETGPWLSRPMRVEFGLQPLEQRIGLSAHDFMRAFGAKEVYLTRASKVGGTPTIPCRWLLRLETLLGTSQWGSHAKAYLDWGKVLDTPFESLKLNPPEPKPPVHLRPKHLSVTQIETWMRDPYAIYARHILKLKKLDPLKPEPTAADRGTIIHKCLERYKKEGGESLNDLFRNRCPRIQTSFPFSLCDPVLVASIYSPGRMVCRRG